MEVQITYLLNSGFLLRANKRALVFDCYSFTPERGGRGIVNPSELEDDDVYVFVSHAHYDHYNPAIFGWEKQIKIIRYILSYDVPKHAGAVVMRPDQTRRIGDIDVTALRSTDEGVAFLAAFDGLTVYHAGDLNWWHWEGEDPAWNRQMETDYRREIAKLKGVKIDIAFVPVDPRLGDSLYLGAELLLKTTDVGILIPMHYGTSAQAVERLIKPTPTEREKILPPMKRGQTVTLNCGESCP